MIRTTSIDQLCSGLAEQKPYWDVLIDKFQHSPRYLSNQLLQLDQYAQEFSESYLDISLENLSKEMMKGKIEFLQYTQTNKLINEGCTLFRNHRNRILITLEDGTNYEYDQIAFIENVPVVFEIKIRRWDSRSHSMRKQKSGHYKLERNGGIKSDLQPEIYLKKLELVKKIFNQDVGYIIIISSDQYQKACNSPQDSTVGRFLQNNGKIVPFYADRLTFREHVREKVREFGYPLKEEPPQQPKYNPQRS